MVYSQQSNIWILIFRSRFKLNFNLRSCTPCLENYVHLILSQFADYLTIKDNFTLKQDIMFTIYIFAKQITLSDNCAILFQSFMKILELHSESLPGVSSQTIANNPILTPNSNNQLQQPPVLSITYLLFSNSSSSPMNLTDEKLSASSKLGVLTIETLYLLSRQMGGRFFVYAPMFDRILMKNKSYAKLYEQMVVYCREATFHTVWTQSVSMTSITSTKPPMNTIGQNSNVESSMCKSSDCFQTMFKLNPP